jgi:CubicO group peptidase (beta-lactamase class C family)
MKSSNQRFAARPDHVALESCPKMKFSTRLHALAPIITEILDISGGEGVAIGVLDHGTVHHANFGHRNVDADQEPDQDTIFPIASLSKAFTAAAVGILVEEHRLTWNTPLREILSDFGSTEEAVRDYCTIVDLLAHCHGISGPGSIWLQGNNQILLKKDDLVPSFSAAKAKFPFRREFGYSNLGVAMAGHVVEKLSGQSISDFLRDRIFRPLGMNRTSIGLPSAGEKNMAHAYAALENTTRVPIQPPRIEATTFMAPAIGVRSTVRDLLIAYQHLMRAANEQSLARSPDDSDPIFK